MVHMIKRSLIFSRDTEIIYKINEYFWMAFLKNAFSEQLMLAALCWQEEHISWFECVIVWLSKYKTFCNYNFRILYLINCRFMNSIFCDCVQSLVFNHLYISYPKGNRYNTDRWSRTRGGDITEISSIIDTATHICTNSKKAEFKHFNSSLKMIEIATNIAAGIFDEDYLFFP